MKIVSFHYFEVDPIVRIMQQRVFDKFNLEIEQSDTTLSHFEAIDKWIAKNWLPDSKETLVLLDGDCIPLSAKCIQMYEYEAFTNKCIVGAEQNANHLKDTQDYISPAFMVLPSEVYNHIGRPSFAPTSRSDCAGEISYAAKEKNVRLSFLKVSHVEKAKWRLSGSNRMFGWGTTYDGSIYHSFESRMNNNSISMFTRKCKEILDSKIV